VDGWGGLEPGFPQAILMAGLQVQRGVCVFVCVWGGGMGVRGSSTRGGPHGRPAGADGVWTGVNRCESLGSLRASEGL
jgi:hypothetical protein